MATATAIATTSRCAPPVRLRWPTRADLLSAAESCVGAPPARCPICAEALYEPLSCARCSLTLCLVCFCALERRPLPCTPRRRRLIASAGGACVTIPCPVCSADDAGWMRNLAARDAQLASPEWRDAYLARHDALCAAPIQMLMLAVRAVAADARIRWSRGLPLARAFSMLRAAINALMEHTAADAREGSQRTHAIPNGVIVTHTPSRAAATAAATTTTAAAGSGAGKRSLVHACTSEWGDNWTEFQSDSLGYAICAQSPPPPPNATT